MYMGNVTNVSFVLDAKVFFKHHSLLQRILKKFRNDWILSLTIMEKDFDV